VKDHPDHPADIQCSICKLLIREGGTPVLVDHYQSQHRSTPPDRRGGRRHVRGQDRWLRAVPDLIDRDES